MSEGGSSASGDPRPSSHDNVTGWKSGAENVNDWEYLIASDWNYEKQNWRKWETTVYNQIKTSAVKKGSLGSHCLRNKTVISVLWRLNLSKYLIYLINNI